MTEIMELVPENHYTVKVRVMTKPQEVRSRTGLMMVKIRVCDETGNLNVVWFNNRFIKNSIKQEDELFLYGKVKVVGRDVVMELQNMRRFQAQKV